MQTENSAVEGFSDNDSETIWVDPNNQLNREKTKPGS